MNDLNWHLEHLPEQIGYLEFIARVKYLKDKYRNLVLEKESEDTQLLLEIAALCVKMTDSITKIEHNWAEEMDSQALDVAELPNVFVVVGLMETLISDLEVCFSIHESVDIDPLIKLGTVCIRRFRDVSPNEREERAD